MRHPTPDPPERTGTLDGLAYALFEPDEAPAGGVVVLHGAGSCKENHFDFARAARDAGLAAVAFDQRGHGETGGALDDRLVDDVAAIATLLPRPLAVRGSSMGGYVAILAAARLRAAAAVVVCPAGAHHLLRGLHSEAREFQADVPLVERFLEDNDVTEAVASLECPLLVMHAEGDERIPVEHSRALIEAATAPRSRLVALPGGHHRSIQHDAEMQGESLRFISRAFARAGSEARR